HQTKPITSVRQPSAAWKCDCRLTWIAKPQTLAASREAIMRITVLVVRLLETGLLLWSIYSLHFTTRAADLTTFTEMSGYHYQWFEFSMDPDSHRVVASTLHIGYVLS